MCNVTPQNFEEQMKVIKNNYDVIRLENIYEELKCGTRDAVVITFDDGYSSVIKNAYPILEKYNLPATIFLTTENIGKCKENWTDNIMRCIFEPKSQKDFFEITKGNVSQRWYTRNLEEKVALYRQISFIFKHSGRVSRECYEKQIVEWAGLEHESAREDRKILTESELKKLSESPLITIGAHCVTHPSLRALDIREQEEEIGESKDRIEEIIGKKINLFAYPFGTHLDFSNDTVEILKNKHFDMAVATTMEDFKENTNTYAIPRYMMLNYNEENASSYLKKIFERDCPKNNKNDKQSVIVTSLECDEDIILGTAPIILWGCGYWGNELYNTLKLCGMEKRIIAFADNDPQKIGNMVNGLLILEKKKIKEMQNDEQIIILVKNVYDYEICSDLVKYGIRNVHLIQR